MKDSTQNLRVVVVGGGKLAELIWMMEVEKEREGDRQEWREKEEICFFLEKNLDHTSNLTAPLESPQTIRILAVQPLPEWE